MQKAATKNKKINDSTRNDKKRNAKSIYARDYYVKDGTTTADEKEILKRLNTQLENKLRENEAKLCASNEAASSQVIITR